MPPLCKGVYRKKDGMVGGSNLLLACSPKSKFDHEQSLGREIGGFFQIFFFFFFFIVQTNNAKYQTPHIKDTNDKKNTRKYRETIQKRRTEIDKNQGVDCVLVRPRQEGYHGLLNSMIVCLGFW